MKRRSPSICRSIYLSIFLAAGALLATPCVGATSAHDIATAALQTQKQCQMQLHHDADTYIVCVDQLLAAHLKRDAVRLGIAYFGWVGALNSARISLPGAAFAADRYLRQFRKTQRALKVDDMTLCQTVPGNCTERLARMRQLEALPPMKTDPSAADNSHP